jgi:hypothetical protein
LVYLLENFTDHTSGINGQLKSGWKAVFHRWDRPKPTPGYQLGWKDKTAAKKPLQRIFSWDFERLIGSMGIRQTMQAYLQPGKACSRQDTAPFNSNSLIKAP